jgi:outer membrane protein OmpA-like peptidoglycan-associated protein
MTESDHDNRLEIINNMNNRETMKEEEIRKMISSVSVDVLQTNNLAGGLKMKAITAKRLLIFVFAVFSINLMVGCAHMCKDQYGCPSKCSAAVAAPEPAPMPEKVVILAAEPKVEEKVVAAIVEPKIVVLAFEDIHFDFDKSTLKPEAQIILKRNIQIMKDNPKAQVRIAGYTSASGTEEYNQKLSERRAKAVEEYLVNEGIISPDRLTMIGYGETNPASYEAAPKVIYSKAAKSNMRVLFEIVVR